MSLAAAAQWFDPELRDLLRVLLYAALLSLLAVYGFRRNAPAKRGFVLFGSVLLLALPLLLAALPLVLPVGVPVLAPLTIGLPLPSVLLAIWLIPALVLVTRTLIANAAARQRLRALPAVQHPAAQASAAEIARQLGCRGTPILKQGPAACCLTLPAPMIILPPALLAGPPQALRAVLTHELVHARRYDDRWLLFMQLVLDWYWWMPWLRTLAQRFEQAVEESCDDRAADFFAPGHDYLSGVLEATRDDAQAHSDNAAQQAARKARAAYMSAHPLVGRVLRFGRRRDHDADWPYVGGCALSLLFGLLLVTGIEPVAVAPAPSLLTLHYGPERSVSGPAAVQQAVQQPQIQSRHLFVSQPRLLSALRAHRLCEEHQPIYPGAALLQGQEADVEVLYRIGQDGQVVAVRLVSGDQHGLFERAALAAIKRNRYPPLHSVQRSEPARLMDPRETGPPLEVRQRFAFRLTRAI
ncbi:MAG: TonB family protein [Pseudomonadales bacterium]